MNLDELLQAAPSVAQALEQTLTYCNPLGSEYLPATGAVGRCVRRQVQARLNLPGWAKSAMDGYAMRAADTAGASSAQPHRLPITGTVTAGGDEFGKVQEGACVRIMTGSLIPDGTDCVAPVEDMRADGDTLVIERPLDAGACVRAAGAEVRQGDVLAPAGKPLDEEQIELLASQGILEVEAGTRPRVALFSTGDEIIVPTEQSVRQELPRGAIFNSNNHYLGALVEEAGGIPIRLGIAADDMDAITAKIEEGSSADVVIITGGTGLGDKDLVAPAMQKCGVEIVFKNVRMRPGTFIAVGKRGRTLYFSLSGFANAAAITFELLARPALRALQGFTQQPYPEVEAALDHDLRLHPGLPNYLRGVVSWRGNGWRASRWSMRHVSESVPINALLLAPPEIARLRKGDAIRAILTQPQRLHWQ